jgi:hypothetical protein
MVCQNKEIFMNKMIKSAAIGLVLLTGLSVAQAAKPRAVDTSVDGIFTALTASRNLQSTIDKLIAAGADYHSVISIAAAAGIPESKIQKLQVCVNAVSEDSRVLSATCMRPTTVMTAYAAGVNDPLNYLPATAAGKRAK